MKMTMLGSIFVLLGIAFGLSACTGLGRPLGGERPYHHLEKGFRNPPDSPRRSSDLSVRLPFFAQAVWRSLTQNKSKFPRDHAAEKAEARAQFAALGDADALAWIGHATFLVRLDGVTVLTDPVFGRRASPVSFAGPERVLPPGLDIEDLPPIDVVVISHAHYDHLDTWTLDRLPGREKITAIVPLGLGKYFTARGYGTVYEVDWYDDVTLEGRSGPFKLTAYPAVHWANRSLFDVNRTLWMSYGFSANGRSVYHSGDTETHPYMFREIGEHMATHHNGCDIGLMSAGAYNPRPMMQGAHADPEGVAQIGRDVGCKRMVPMHWGTFVLSLEPFLEPPQRFEKAVGNQTLNMRIGESIGLSALFDD